MLTAIIPVVFILAGAGIYVFSTNPKLAEIGRLVLAAGAFALAFSLAGKAIAL